MITTKVERGGLFPELAIVPTHMDTLTPALLASVDRLDLAAHLGGRVHPVLVHFPIAFLILAASVELFVVLRRRHREPLSPTTRLLTIVGMLAAGAAVGSGLLNGQFEQAKSWTPAMETHRNVGFVTLGLAVAVGLHAIFVPAKRLLIFRLGLFAAAAAVGLTGHLGGSLTYGPDYLTGPLKQLLGIAAPPPPKPAPPQPANPAAKLPPIVGTPDFVTQIQPILEKTCWRCHGPAKHKGGLRLDSLQALLTGGKNGPAIVLNSAEQSHVIERVTSTDPDLVMPPEDPGLTPDQVALLRAWIDGGAPWPS